MHRDTVGSEATGPNTSGCARSCAMSARQSPPTARLSARSSTILPGSCRVNRLRHGVSAALNAASSPTAMAVRVSSTAPAPETTLRPDPSTTRRGIAHYASSAERCLLAARILPSTSNILAGQRHLSCFRASGQLTRGESPGLAADQDRVGRLLCARSTQAVRRVGRGPLPNRDQRFGHSAPPKGRCAYGSGLRPPLPPTGVSRRDAGCRGSGREFAAPGQASEGKGRRSCAGRPHVNVSGSGPACP